MGTSRNFDIENGVLNKFFGSGKTAVVPEGVTIIGKNAFRGCMNLVTVTLPNSVTRIEDDAFNSCSALKSITLPEGLKSIGSCAFLSCRNLTSVTIPERVETIGKNAFARCDNIEINVSDIAANRPNSFHIDNGKLLVYTGPGGNVVVPENVTSIASQAFEGCSSLTSIVLPAGLESVGERAISGCGLLERVVLPLNYKMINNDVFTASPVKDFVFPKEPGFGRDPLPLYLCKGHINVSDHNLAQIVLFQKLKKWQNWLREGNVNNPAGVFAAVLEILANDETIDEETGNRAVQFGKDFGSGISSDAIRKLIAVLKEKQYPNAEKFDSDNEIQELLNVGSDEEHPVEEIVRKAIAKNGMEPFTDKAVKTGIHFAGESRKCSREALMLILTESAREWDRLVGVNKEGFARDMCETKNAKKARFSDAVMQTVAALDSSELSEFLMQQTETQSYRRSLLAFSRFADDDAIERICSNFNTMARGKAREKYKAANMQETLLLSNTRAAMLFYDRIGDLDRYAALRGLEAMDMRDTIMLPDFNLDVDGKKRFDIGDSIIEVSITEELQFALYDTGKGKEIKSFPKKSSEPAKAEAAAKSFATFKKEITEFIKLRSAHLHKLHISGNPIKEELWHKVYVEHPVIRFLSQLIIWEDASGHTFTVIGVQTVDHDLQQYEPQGDIRVAHVIEMSPADIAAWQETLAKQSKKQLFDQIWEPIIQWSPEEISTRYQGVRISQQARNQLRQRLKQRGVNAHAADMEREFDYRAGKYEFSGESTMLFGNCLTIDYYTEEAFINDKGKFVEFGKAKTSAKPGNREMNVVLFELDRITLAERIAGNDVTALTEQMLSTFTVAQISEFINVGLENKATECTASLLNYKNEHYPSYADMSVFSLDW